MRSLKLAPVRGLFRTLAVRQTKAWQRFPVVDTRDISSDTDASDLNARYQLWRASRGAAEHSSD